MNAQSKVRAMPSARAATPSGPSQQAVSGIAGIDYRGENRELRDRLQAERLNAIRLRGTARRLAWAMRGLCRQAEDRGIDATYWRDLARDAEGAVYD
jgi:hypothetical protein